MSHAEIVMGGLELQKQPETRGGSHIARNRARKVAAHATHTNNIIDNNNDDPQLLVLTPQHLHLCLLAA